MVDLTINGKELSVEAGTTILEASLKNGIHIPHLCWDQRLTPFGGCRLCLVEWEGSPKLFASCATPVKKGMVINTESDRIAKARKVVLELLLIHHPLDCPICDKAGECELQDLAFKYGTTESRFVGEKKHEPEILEAPLLERNPNRCILCGKCVRICQEHQGVGAINFIGRGFDVKISPAFEETLDCEFCGQCIDVCPVGALGAKPYRFRSRVWFMEEKKTTCSYCGCGCTLSLGIGEGKIMRSVGRDGVGINKGDLCGRGRFGFDYVYSDKRLTKPMIKKEGNLQEVSWEEAVDFLTEKLSKIKEMHGAEAIGAIGSQRCTVEDNYMLQKFMRQAIGTDNIDSLARFGYAKAQAAIKKSFGLNTLPVEFEGALKADAILVVESDLTSTLPVFGLKALAAARDFGAKLTVIDPRSTKLTRYSTEWLRGKPGTAVATLNTMMKVILDAGSHSKDAESLPKFNELKTSLADYTPEHLEAITGLSYERVASAAKEFAAGENRKLYMTLGVNENNKGSDTVLAAANLLMLVGSGPEDLQIPAELSNTLGMFEAGIRPDATAGHVPVAKKGLDLEGMLYSDDSTIKAMYIMGENPVVSFPRAHEIEEKLKGLELLIVQDINMTDTAKLADVVLPGAAWSEKEGMMLGATGIPQKAIKCSTPKGEAIADWQILRNISRAMQKATGLGDSENIQDEIKKAIKFEYTIATATLSFNPVKESVGEAVDADYPFNLVTGNLMQHSGSLSTLSKSLESVVADAYMLINNNDAKGLEIKDDTFIKVTSRRGEVLLKARVTSEVPEGMLFAPAHFPHARVHELTYQASNGGPNLVAVKVERS